jgi:hypothetical protein
VAVAFILTCSKTSVGVKNPSFDVKGVKLALISRKKREMGRMFQALCKIRGFHAGHYEQCRLLGYKKPSSYVTGDNYASVTEPSQLMLCKI